MIANRLAKVLLRTAKASYVRMDKIDYKQQARCKTCGELLNNRHVSRRMKSRIVAKFCVPCFEKILLVDNLIVQ